MIERFDSFVGIITRLYKAIQKQKTENMSHLGLRGPHTMCLFYLSQYPDGLSASRLCELSGSDKAAVSRTLAELEQSGLLTYSAPVGMRKYRTRARLTEKGIAVTDQIDRTICELVEQAVQGVSEEDRRAMYRALSAISANLEKS